MPQTRASIFESDGIPAFSKALPLALQHVVAMIVGCVTPAILISDVAGLNERDRVILVQAALFVSAISTLLQLFPVFNGKKFQLGSRLPVIMGISFDMCPVCRRSPNLMMWERFWALRLSAVLLPFL